MKRSTNRCWVLGSNNNEAAVLLKPPSKPEPLLLETSGSMQVPTRGSGNRQISPHTPATCVQSLSQSPRSDNDKESCRYSVAIGLAPITIGPKSAKPSSEQHPRKSVCRGTPQNTSQTTKAARLDVP